MDSLQQGAKKLNRFHITWQDIGPRHWSPQPHRAPPSVHTLLSRAHSLVMLSEWTSVFPNVYSTASWLWGRGLLADSASASRTPSKPPWKTSIQSHGRVLLLRDVLGEASSGRAPSPLKRTGSAKQRRRGSSASLEPPALQHQVQSMTAQRAAELSVPGLALSVILGHIARSH